MAAIPYQYGGTITDCTAGTYEIDFNFQPYTSATDLMLSAIKVAERTLKQINKDVWRAFIPDVLPVPGLFNKYSFIKLCLNPLFIRPPTALSIKQLHKRKRQLRIQKQLRSVK